MSGTSGTSGRTRPTLVRGVDVVVDGEGVAHRVERPVVALCVCGRSRSAPWCDSTHRLLDARRD